MVRGRWCGLSSSVRVGASAIASVLAGVLLLAGCASGAERGATSGAAESVSGGASSSASGSAQLSDVVGPTINIGIPVDQPGMGFSERVASGARGGVGASVSGFHATIARALALDLGYSDRQINWVEVNDQNQDLLFSTGKVDMVVGVSQYSQSSTGEGAHSVEFAGPYLTAPLGIMTSPVSGNLTSFDSLTGKRVCTVRGEYPDTATAQRVRELSHQTAQSFEQDTYSQCLAALGTGTVDAVVGSEVVLEQFAKAIQGQNFRIHEVSDVLMSYGVSVPSGDVRLWAKIQNKLRDVVADGQWSRAFASVQSDSVSALIRKMKAPQIAEPPREKYS